MTQTLIQTQAAKPNLGPKIGLEFPEIQALSPEEFTALKEHAATEPDYTDIILHSKPACVQCNAVKRALENFGLAPDQVIDLSTDENAELRDHIMNVKGIQQVPFTVYGATEFMGFRPDLLPEIAKDRLTFLTSLL